MTAQLKDVYDSPESSPASLEFNLLVEVGLIQTAAKILAPIAVQ
jgi:hypothetical protein